MNKELLRQGLHMLGGTCYLAIIFFLPKEVSLAIIAGIFVVGAIAFTLHRHVAPLPLIKEILKGAERKNEKGTPGIAAMEFALSTLVCAIVFFPFSKMVLLGAIAVLTYGDGISTLAGKIFGRTKILGGKSLEGSLAGVAAASIALLIFFPAKTAVPAAIIGMAAEYLPMNDNYAIPLAAGIALVFLI